MKIISCTTIMLRHGYSIFLYSLSLFLSAVIFFSTTGNAYATVDFDHVYGSDLGMGVGARAIGLGGAFTAVSDDASAVFWNPAGLTRLEHNEIMVTGYLPPGLGAASLVFKPAFRKLGNIHFTLGFSYINRLDFKGDSKDDTWEGNASHLLDISMIDIGSDFQGKIDSETYDTRLSLAFNVPYFPRLSLGVNLAAIT